MRKLGANSKQVIQDWEVLSLLAWPPGRSDALSQLILGLKQAPEQAWRYYAQQFYFKWAADFVQNEETFLISHQSLSGNRHAANWAQSLSAHFGFPHLEALALEKSAISQKTLNLRQRKERTMRPLVEISRLSHQSLVFVDDVVTSGFTALAAYKALGRPKKFQIWCLAWRPASSIAVK